MFDEIIDSYLEEENAKIMNNHPEIENYGLNLDYNTWANLNLELQVREKVTMKRLINQEYVSLDQDPPTDEERLKCYQIIQSLIEIGKIDGITYLERIYK